VTLRGILFFASWEFTLHPVRVPRMAFGLCQTGQRLTSNKLAHDKADPFRFYAGYVPSGEYFRMMADDVVELAGEESGRSVIRNNLCFIGLIAYFEAFAKDQLGSVLSLAPAAIDRLEAAGHATDITAREALGLKEDIEHQVGFLIAHRLDLGTAKKINAAFSTAVKVTPFGKDGIAKYSKMLRDRNLMVHHGGTYTTAYIEQAFDEIDPRERTAHAYSIKLAADDIKEAADFLKRIARAMVETSAKALEAIVTADGTGIDPARRKAIEFMPVWGDEAEKADAKLQTQIDEFERPHQNIPTEPPSGKRKKPK
jgi:hypothetical protein